jgi:hypothetical protein
MGPIGNLVTSFNPEGMLAVDPGLWLRVQLKVMDYQQLAPVFRTCCFESTSNTVCDEVKPTKSSIKGRANANYIQTWASIYVYTRTSCGSVHAMFARDPLFKRLPSSRALPQSVHRAHHPYNRQQRASNPQSMTLNQWTCGGTPCRPMTGHISLSGCQLLNLTSTHARYLKHVRLRLPMNSSK